ncbi:MAG: response regulator transcription factor [Anaerolineales bacterium]|nr:response regulator transcription factor [Chloroflexota bacterium]MBL6980336.1 response regulator transcription factor [Anaerolineales bacterium]
MTEQDKIIRVLVVDDHAVVRSGLGAFLQAFDDLDFIGEADSGEKAIVVCEQLQPDVVMMDMKMPGMGGVRATQEIHKRFPKIRIIALTSFKDQESVHGALKAGATGYLLKNATAEELTRAIRAAYLGQTTLAPEATQALVQGKRLSADDVYGLTPREKEVLALIVQGQSNPQIAESLVVSISTVKFHVSAIISKLGAKSRTEVVAIAMQNNLVD